MIQNISVNVSACHNVGSTNTVSDIVVYKVIRNNWIYAQVCFSISFLFNTLVFASLLKFARCNRKFYKNKKSKTLMRLALSYPVVSCVKIVAQQNFLIVGKIFTENHQGCSACYWANVLQTLASFLCALNIFLFLWYRLQMLLSERPMKKFCNFFYKSVNCFSFAVYILIIVVLIALAFAGLFPEFSATNEGCLVVESKINVYSCLVTISLVNKLLMLAFFVYPLLVKKIQLLREKSPTSRKNLLEQRLYSAIKRSALSAFIFPLFNALVYAINVVEAEVKMSSLKNGVTSVCYMFTGVCIVLCFENPTDILTIMFSKNKRNRGVSVRMSQRNTVTDLNETVQSKTFE